MIDLGWRPRRASGETAGGVGGEERMGTRRTGEDGPFALVGFRHCCGRWLVDWFSLGFGD